MKIPKVVQKITDALSCVILMTFVLACYYMYLSVLNNVISLMFMVATVLWFYSFLIDLGHLFGFLED